MSQHYTEKMDIIEKAKKFAIDSHANTNHTYDGMPYANHLQMVVESAGKFIHLIPKQSVTDVFCACWLHDTIEDCRITFNDLKKVTNENVAEIVYAVSNEKGRTRKERANDKYYAGIRETPFATFVKLCDRIANIEYSLRVKSDMFQKYKNEHEEFNARLYCEQYKPMFLYLIDLLHHSDNVVYPV